MYGILHGYARLYSGQCPELLGYEVQEVEQKLTELLVRLAAYHLPWNILLLGKAVSRLGLVCNSMAA